MRLAYFRAAAVVSAGLILIAGSRPSFSQTPRPVPPMPPPTAAGEPRGECGQLVLRDLFRDLDPAVISPAAGG